MREVVLRLAVKNYERARDVLAQVTERTQRTLDAVKGVTASLREGVELARQLPKESSGGASLDDRAAEVRQRDLQALDRQRFGKAIGWGKEHLEKGLSVWSALSSGDLGQALPGLATAAAPLLPGIGPFLALVLPLEERLRKYLDEKLQRELALSEARLMARLDARALDRDYNRRIAEDPAFARQEARRALSLTLAEEARLGKRVERTRADLVTDFGL